MSLSKKHFEKVAKILNREYEEQRYLEDDSPVSSNGKEAIEHLIEPLITYFKGENALFNAERFRKAVFKEAK